MLFLSLRKSQVDVIRAVGRVMRRAEGKRFRVHHPARGGAGGHGAGALVDNKPGRVAGSQRPLRAHDSAWTRRSTLMELNGKGPENILVEQVSLEGGRTIHSCARWGRGRGQVLKGPARTA